MKTSFVLIFLIATLYVPLSWAQCATGVDTGGQCIPPDALEPQGNSNQPTSQPRQPSAVWEKRWGAIVIDDNNGKAGNSVNYSSKSEAVNAAMNDCVARGGQQCKVQLAYYNQCAAIAWGDTSHISYSGPAKENAESLALSSCGKATTNCKIVYTACSLPARIQ